MLPKIKSKSRKNANPVVGLCTPWYKKVCYLIEHSLIANKRQAVGVSCLYLIISLNKLACTSSSDAFAKIGQAICAILT